MNCNCCTRNSHQRIGTRTGGPENNETALCRTVRILRRVLETSGDLLSPKLRERLSAFCKTKCKRTGNLNAHRIYSQDIGMEFGIEKCAMLVMKSGKRLLTDGMELPYKDEIKTLAENETYKYLGILEADTIKQAEMKEKIQLEYLR